LASSAHAARMVPVSTMGMVPSPTLVASWTMLIRPNRSICAGGRVVLKSAPYIVVMPYAGSFAAM
jgi:hypothetical protein